MFGSFVAVWANGLWCISELGELTYGTVRGTIGSNIQHTPSLVGNIAAVACYIATQNNILFDNLRNQHHIHSVKLHLCMQYGVIFSINVCLSTCKDLPFTSFQRSLMLSMFLDTFSSVKHAIFVYIAKYCQTCSRIFLSHPGTVNHIWIHIC